MARAAGLHGEARREGSWGFTVGRELWDGDTSPGARGEIDCSTKNGVIEEGHPGSPTLGTSACSVTAAAGAAPIMSSAGVSVVPALCTMSAEAVRHDISAVRVVDSVRNSARASLASLCACRS